MARIKFDTPAPPGSLFDESSFASEIGKTMPLTILGRPAGSALLVDASIRDGGRWAELTVESVDDDAREGMARLGAS